MTTAFDSFQDVVDRYDPPKNQSRPVLTKFERAKVIGLRMEQLSRGSRPMVEVAEGDTVRDVALRELSQKKMPYVLARSMPNGTTEYFRVGDLQTKR